MNMIILDNQTVIGYNSMIFKQMKSEHFVAFKSATGKTYTSYKLTDYQSIRHNKTNRIGKYHTKK
jgi:hypothetical protein